MPYWNLRLSRKMGTMGTMAYEELRRVTMSYDAAKANTQTSLLSLQPILLPFSSRQRASYPFYYPFTTLSPIFLSYGIYD